MTEQELIKEESEKVKLANQGLTEEELIIEVDKIESAKADFLLFLQGLDVHHEPGRRYVLTYLAPTLDVNPEIILTKTDNQIMPYSNMSSSGKGQPDSHLSNLAATIVSTLQAYYEQRSKPSTSSPFFRHSNLRQNKPKTKAKRG